jgi:hypothetical protein
MQKIKNAALRTAPVEKPDCFRYLLTNLIL